MEAITREEAKFLYIQAGWAEEWSDRLRNYEIEVDLAELSGIDVYQDDHEQPYVIAEWCPFNGIFCAWRDHAPNEVLEQAIAVWETNRETWTREGFRVDYHIELLRKAMK